MKLICVYWNILELGSTNFFVPDLSGGLRVLTNGYDLRVPQTFLTHFCLIFGSLRNVLHLLRGATGWRRIPLPRHECTFLGTTTTLWCTSWATAPGPNGSPESWIIIHAFSHFQAIFRLLRPWWFFSFRTFLGAPGCLLMYGCFIPSLPTIGLFWLSRQCPPYTSQGLRMALNFPSKAWVCLTRDYHNPWVHPMSTGARPRREPGVVDYSPHFFQFSSHFSTFWARQLFSSWTFLGGPGCDGYRCLTSSFLAHFCLILARLASPSLYSVGPSKGVKCPFPSISLPSKGLRQPLGEPHEHQC